jgi:hypothetical protein
MDAHHLALQRDGLVEELAILVKALFFRARPDQPIASRWTGVAGSARWHAGVTLFFGILEAILDRMGWAGASVAALRDFELESEPRKFLGARRAVYAYFLKEGNCAMLSLIMVVGNHHIRQMLGFLFKNSYEDKGSISPGDHQKLTRLWSRYLLEGDPPEDVPEVSALAVWTSGQVSGQALAGMADLMLGTLISFIIYYAY